MRAVTTRHAKRAARNANRAAIADLARTLYLSAMHLADHVQQCANQFQDFLERDGARGRGCD